MTDTDAAIRATPWRDPQILERLRLAKSVYDHAHDHSTRSGRVDRLIAIHGFHLATEIVLRVIVQKEDPQAMRGDDPVFRDLLKSASKSRGGQSPTGAYQQLLRHLNEYRNMAQHAARTPDEDVLSEFRTSVRAFLVDTYKAHFGLDFDDLSDADLISDDNIRGLLKKVEELRRKLEALMASEEDEEDQADDERFKVHQTALALTEAAFTLACRLPLSEFDFADFQEIQRPPELLEQLSQGESGDAALSVIWDRLRRLEVSSLLAHIGVDYLLFQELLEHSPSVVVVDGKGVFVDPRNEALPDASRLDRLSRFAVSCVLDWQDRGFLQSDILSASRPGDPFVILAEAIARGEMLEMFDMVPLGELNKDSFQIGWLPTEF